MTAVLTSAFLYSGLTMYQLLFVLFCVVWVPLFPYRISRLVTFIIHAFSSISTILAWEGLFSVLASSWKHCHYMQLLPLSFPLMKLVAFAHGSVIKRSWLKSAKMYLEILASKMPSEEMYHLLLLVLWTSHVAHPAASSRSPCFCFLWLWLVPLFLLEWIAPTRSSSVNPEPLAGAEWTYELLLWSPPILHCYKLLYWVMGNAVCAWAIWYFLLNLQLPCSSYTVILCYMFVSSICLLGAVFICWG